LGYSEKREFQADANGLRLAMKAGYSGRAALQLFDTIIAYEKENGVTHGRPKPSGVGGDIMRNLDEHFRSHPPTAQRKARLEQLLQRSSN